MSAEDAESAKKAIEVEGAAEYLQRHQFKALLEYLTAETILNRPDDPFTFLQKVLQSKISKRAGGEYKPEDNTDMVKDCYAKASAEADETGRVTGGSSDFEGEAKKAASVAYDGSTEHERLQLMEKIIAASRAIAMQLDPFAASKSIVSETTKSEFGLISPAPFSCRLYRSLFSSSPLHFPLLFFSFSTPLRRGAPLSSSPPSPLLSRREIHL